MLPTKKDLPLTGLISNHKQEIPFVSKSSHRLALILSLTYTIIPPPPFVSFVSLSFLKGV